MPNNPQKFSLSASFESSLKLFEMTCCNSSTDTSIFDNVEGLTTSPQNKDLSCVPPTRYSSDLQTESTGFPPTDFSLLSSLHNRGTSGSTDKTDVEQRLVGYQKVCWDIPTYQPVYHVDREVSVAESYLVDVPAPKYKVHETVRKISKPLYLKQERVVEDIQTVHRDKIVEVPVNYTLNKLVYKNEIKEVVREVPKYVEKFVEREVEIPEIKYVNKYEFHQRSPTDTVRNPTSSPLLTAKQNLQNIPPPYGDFVLPSFVVPAEKPLQREEPPVVFPERERKVPRVVRCKVRPLHVQSDDVCKVEVFVPKPVYVPTEPPPFLQPVKGRKQAVGFRDLQTGRFYPTNRTTEPIHRFPVKLGDYPESSDSGSSEISSEEMGCCGFTKRD